MKNQIELPWIEAGYQLFSKEGPAGLKVDILARAVGISRSSFYHLFGDLDIFQEKLLMYHSEMASNVAESVKLCKNIEPDFLLMMIKYQDYFFSIGSSAFIGRMKLLEGDLKMRSLKYKKKHPRYGWIWLAWSTNQKWQEIFLELQRIFCFTALPGKL